MIKKQLGAVFSSHVFYFVGAGGMMGGSYFHGEPGAASVPASAPPLPGGDRYSYASIVVLTNPLLYWKLDDAGGATDTTDFIASIVATATGSAVSGASVIVSSTEDTSWRFDGTTGALQTPLHVANELLRGAPAATIEAWIDADTLGTDDIVFNMHVGNGLAGINLSGSAANTMRIGGRSTIADAFQSVTIDLGAQSSSLMHVVGVLNYETDSLSMWVNASMVIASTGVTWASTAFAYSSAGMVDGTTIGFGFTVQFFDGNISHVALYASALTAEVISDHYLYGIGDLPLAVVPPTGLSYASVVLLDEPIAYWQFNETTGSTALDSIASAYQGTYTNGVTLGASTLIADASVFAIDYASTAAQHVALTSSPARGKDQFTSEIWFRPASYASTGHRTPLYYEQNDISFLRYMLSFDDTDGFRLDVRATESGTVFTVFAPGSSVVLDHDYHVVAISHSSANTLQIFQNGVEVAASTTALMSVIFDDAGAFAGMGNPAVSGARGHVHGRLDDVALYDKVLSSAEVRSHYARGKYASSTYPFAVINDGAVAYWRVNDANGAADAFSDIGVRTAPYIGTVSTGAPGLLGAAESATTAMELNAISSSGFSLGDTQLYPLTGSNTIEYWFKTSSTSATTRIAVLKGALGNYIEVGLYMKNTGHMRYAISSSNTGGGAHGASTPVAMWDGGTHHVVGVHDNPNNAINVYINGVMAASATFSADGYNGTSPFTVGYQHGINNSWIGILDEIAVYATALTEDQIRSHNAHGRHFESTYPFIVITDKPAGYWRFGEADGASSAYPDAGTYTGTYVGTVSSTAALVFSSTETNTALALTGIVSSGVNLGDVDLFDRTGSHSLEAWFQSATATEQTIITKGLIAGSWAEYQLLLQPGGSIKYSVTSTDDAGGLHTAVTPASTYADGGVHHVVAVHNNPSNYQHVYIDGALVVSATFSSDVWSSDADVTIGYSRSSSSVTRPFNGTLDDVAVYATALTGAQILDHYSNGKENLHPYVSAIVQAATLYWRLDDPVDASTTTDSIRNVFASAQAGSSAGASSIVSALTDTSWRFDGTGADGGIRLGSTLHEVGATFHGASAMSFEVWVDSDEAAAIETIFTLYPGHEFTTNRAGFVAQFDTGPVLKFVARPNRTQGAETIEINLSTLATTTLHVVGVADWANDLMWLYINGKLAIASTAAVFTTNTWNYQSALVDTPSEIGASESNSRRFNGNISHFSLYKSIVSPEDVREHYRLGVGDDPLLPYVSTIFAAAPVAYWRLGEEVGSNAAYDEVGARTGQYIGTVSTGVAGLIEGDSNTAMALSAVVSSGVKLTSSTLFDRTGSHSFEFWTQYSSTGGGNVITKQTGGVEWPEYQMNTANGTMSYALYSSPANRVATSTGVSLADDRPHHVVGVHNNSGNHIRLYLDGEQVASTTMSSDMFTNTSPHTIGYAHGDAPTSFDGTIDEVAVYNRALAPTEINEHNLKGRGYVPGTYPFTILSDHPVSYWRLDETTGSTAVDVVRAKNGAYTNGVTLGVSAVTRDAGEYAAGFDGTDDHVVIASANNLGNEFTLEAWVICSASSPACSIITEQFTGGSDPISFALGLSNTIGGAATTTFLTVGHFNGTAWAASADAVPFPLNTPVHVVGVKDSAGLKVYRDGIRVASSATTVSVVVDGDEMYIGRRHDTGATNDYFAGVIDEVAVYKSALTSATIQNHYIAGVSYDRMVINDGAQSYWQLDETTGSTAVDTVAGADGEYRGAMALGVSALVENAGAYAARFDGVDDRIYIASAPNIGTARYTLEAWIKVTASSPEVAIIAEEYTGSGTVQYRLGFGQPGSGTTNLSIGHYPGGAWATVEDSIPCPLNEIIHVVGVKDAVGLKVYRNGVLVGSSATVTAAVVDGDGMWIGRQHGAAVYHIGDIDNVAVYATALSSATIAAHYERGI